MQVLEAWADPRAPLALHSGKCLEYGSLHYGWQGNTHRYTSTYMYIHMHLHPVLFLQPYIYIYIIIIVYIYIYTYVCMYVSKWQAKDCAAMLVDLPESISASPEFAEVELKQGSPVKEKKRLYLLSTHTYTFAHYYCCVCIYDHYIPTCKRMSIYTYVHTVVWKEAAQFYKICGLSKRPL